MHNNDFQRLMAEATRLTQAGDLDAATRTIQTALGQAAMPAASRPDLGDVIDMVMPEVRTPAPGPWSPMPMPMPMPAQAPAAPASADFIDGGFGEGSARRAYKLYIPPGAHAGAPLPLVVMLHGCTQNPDDFAAGTGMNELARAEGFFVLYPAQSRKANPQGCWNWFKHSHQQRGRGEPAAIAGMVREVIAHHAVDPARVYVAGLSAGGAMADILGHAYPDLFAAVGVHSGLAAGAATDLPGALSAMKSGASAAARDQAMPTIVFHGDSDATVHPANGGAVLAGSLAGTAAAEETAAHAAPGRRRSTRRVVRASDGRLLAEHWTVHGAGHAWSGGRPGGSYTDGQGPDASAEMLRFFRMHTLART